ncbi:MAG TPA: serine hydrolase domain-containing protein [Acidimicrobiia bacterium]
MRTTLARTAVAILMVASVTGCDRTDQSSVTTTTSMESISLTTTTTAPAPPTTTETDVRIDRLLTWLDEQREATHVPGLAIVVVKDDEVVLAEGLGLADRETSTPVTPETLFPIGSSTKAFTTTLAAMLVDDGTISWDDPVSEHLDYFSPDVDAAEPDAEATLRDLFSHRTGYPRMGVLIADPEVPVETILRTAAGAEPWAGFRERFYYSNVMYLAAGTAIAEAAGSTWVELVEERILDPLGMDDTTTSSEVAMADDDLATGYSWDADLVAFEALDYRPTDNICPAGCLTSTVLDMAEWLRFQLGEGEVDGLRLVSDEQLDETWTEHIPMGGGISYGLGWMLSEWQGQPQIAHGGNVVGFSAQVAMLPEADLGFVMLTNVSLTPLQDLVIPAIWDAFLGELDEDGDSEVSDYEPYLGEYVADFGQFRDERFSIILRDDGIAVDIPGQQVFDLAAPDDEGLWHFELTEEIAISFVRDADDQVVALRLHQSGLVLELPRVGYEFQPEIPLDELERYLGAYRSDDLDLTVTVMIKNNRLAIDWPQEMVYELYPPDDSGVWVFRVTSDFVAEFGETADGEIDSLTYRQPGFEAEFERTEQATTPSIDTVRALRDPASLAAALAERSAFRLTGTIRVPQSGVEGVFTAIADGVDRFRVEHDFDEFGRSVVTVDGTEAWRVPSYGPPDQLHGRMLEQMRQGHPLAYAGDWWQFFDEITVVRATTLDEAPVYEMAMRRENLPRVTAYVDARTGDVIRTDELALIGGGLMIPVTSTYEDFREVAGLRIPLTTTSWTEQSGSVVMSIDEIEVDVDVADDWFHHEP